MRRLQAIMLLLFFCALQSMPVLGITKDSNGELPACCRRAGKHHCAMQMEAMTKSGLAFKSITEKCSCPMHPSVSSQGFTAFVAAKDVFYAGVLSHPACHAQSEAHYRVSFDRSRQKRGPPSNSVSA
ncbi:hypothetical protein [Silvibacterium acidisoli]|uniref:hypothetical protein n=1 Tax=Acidobacteriaceae bacterium ZG23-2 TaxID=2883246 RepID=UPI00406CB710